MLPGKICFIYQAVNSMLVVLPTLDNRILPMRGFKEFTFCCERFSIV